MIVAFHYLKPYFAFRFSHLLAIFTQPKTKNYLCMKLPEILNHNVGQYLNTAAIVEETAQQIMKDFGLFGVIITFS